MNNWAHGQALRVPSGSPPWAPELVSEAWNLPSRPGPGAASPAEGLRTTRPRLAERGRQLQPGLSFTEEGKNPGWAASQAGCCNQGWGLEGLVPLAVAGRVRGQGSPLTRS